MYRIYYTAARTTKEQTHTCDSLVALRAWAMRQAAGAAISGWAIYNEFAGHLVCEQTTTAMKTANPSPTPLNLVHADVSSLVRQAKESAPVLLIGENGKAEGVILGFEDAEDAEDWLMEHTPEAQASFARGRADVAAGRVSSLEDVEREILGQ